LSPPLAGSQLDTTSPRLAGGPAPDAQHGTRFGATRAALSIGRTAAQTAMCWNVAVPAAIRALQPRTGRADPARPLLISQSPRRRKASGAAWDGNPGAWPIRRLTEVTGLVPVEYPTTRKVGATALERAADINAAFADPAIRGILAVIGGEDQITVVPHLDAALAQADPKPFLGTSDNTNLHHWLWANGIASFYGGSSQVHLGPGPRVDDVHARSLRAALITGETLEITDPRESEDVGVDWSDPRALECFGEREPAEPWSWYGPARSVTGHTWGGCLEVIEEILHPPAACWRAGPAARRAARCRRGAHQPVQP